MPWRAVGAEFAGLTFSVANLNLDRLDRWLAWHLPGEWLKNIYPRGMRRLAEMGLGASSRDVTTQHGIAMKVNRVDAIKWCIYYFKQFEPQITRAFTNFLQPGDTVLDIGANIGYHTLLSASRVGPSGRVVAFEPSRRNFDELLANVVRSAYEGIVELHRQAVSDIAGEVEFFYAGDSEQGSSSLIASHAGGQSEIVEAITFGDVARMCDLSRVALIKIDVEGAEERVIRGMIPYFDALPKRCAIFLEISPGNAGLSANLLKPFYDAGFEARMIANEYNPQFFRSSKPVVLETVSLTAGQIVDIVLCRNPETFDQLSG